MDLKHSPLGKAKTALNSFKLSNASQQYTKQKTYQPKKKVKKRADRRRGGPSRHVLEQNPCKLGKKRPMNEKNFYEYLNGIPSLKKEGQIQKEFKDLRKLEKENLQLNEDLKDLNEKLSQMIGKKGYQNLLEQLKERKKVFVERPVSRQVKILNGELQNGEKIIDILTKERERVEKMLQKVVSPVTFSETMRKINEKKKEIKELKSQNFGLVMENKKIGKMLEKGGLGGQGILKKLLMQYNNVKAKNSEMQSEIQRLEGVKAELAKKKENLQAKDKKVQQKLQNAGLRNWDPEIEKKFQNFEKGLKKEQHRFKVVHKNFQVKEAELARKLKNKTKNLTEFQNEYQGKKKLLEKLQKQRDKVLKEKKQVQREEQHNKADPHKKSKSQHKPLRVINNLKKFQTRKSNIKPKIEHKKGPLYSTKTDQENDSDAEIDVQKPNEKSNIQNSLVNSDQNDEIAKLLSQNKSEQKNIYNENTPKEESIKNEDDNDVFGNKTPTLNGSFDKNKKENSSQKESENVLKEKNKNIDNEFNKHKSFSKNDQNIIQNNDDFDDFDELIGKGEEKKNNQNIESLNKEKKIEKENDDDFDFMD